MTPICVVIGSIPSNIVPDNGIFTNAKPDKMLAI